MLCRPTLFMLVAVPVLLWWFFSQFFSVPPAGSSRCWRCWRWLAADQMLPGAEQWPLVRPHGKRHPDQQYRHLWQEGAADTPLLARTDPDWHPVGVRSSYRPSKTIHAGRASTGSRSRASRVVTLICRMRSPSKRSRRVEADDRIRPSSSSQASV